MQSSLHIILNGDWMKNARHLFRLDSALVFSFFHSGKNWTHQPYDDALIVQMRKKKKKTRNKVKIEDSSSSFRLITYIRKTIFCKFIYTKVQIKWKPRFFFFVFWGRKVIENMNMGQPFSANKTYSNFYDLWETEIRIECVGCLVLYIWEYMNTIDIDKV